MAAWLGSDHCQILGLWRHGPPSRPEIVPHHVFVRVGDSYLDGNGILTRADFEAAWTRDGAVDFHLAHIAPYAPGSTPTIIVRDPRAFEHGRRAGAGAHRSLEESRLTRSGARQWWGL